MSDTYKKLLRLTDATVMDDDLGVGFSIETHEGEKLRVFCSVPEVGDIFSFLGALAREACLQTHKEYQGSGPPRNELAPIPAEGMGFQAGPSPDETLLVMRLFGFDLAFSIPSSGLARVADDFARTARTLSADHRRPQ